MTGRTLLEWATILSLAAVGYWAGSWWVWVLVGLAIGTRQHALVMIAHEVAHGRGSRLSRWLSFLPLFMSYEGFRAGHIRHHRYIESGIGPDPEADIHRNPLMVYRWLKYGYITLWSVLAWIVCLVLVPWWAIPAVTVLPVLLWVRYHVEHYRVSYGRRTRTYIPSWWERLVLFPLRINYHAEHHRRPWVPYSRLKAEHLSSAFPKEYTTHGIRELIQEWRA